LDLLRPGILERGLDIGCAVDRGNDDAAALLLARRAVQIGVSILNGQKPASAIELLPSKLVTRDNVAEYKGWTSDRSQ
jgi:hypothetical protein